MKDQFVTYKIALELKELGFDEPCFAVFSDDKYHDLLHVCENQMEGNFTIESFQYGIKAPLWQQAVDFLKKYNILIHEQLGSEGYFWEVLCPYGIKYNFDTLNDAFLYAIKLIKENTI